MIVSKYLLAGLALGFVAANLGASPSVTGTFYNLNSNGTIDYNAPLYSVGLNDGVSLGAASSTLLSSSNPALGAWGLPGSFGVDLTGNLTASEAGWYTFDLSYAGGTVTVHSTPGQNSDTLTQTSVYLPEGDNKFDFQYGDASGEVTSAKFFVEGDDPIQANFQAPDSSEWVCAFPAALCFAHAVWNRRRKK